MVARNRNSQTTSFVLIAVAGGTMAVVLGAVIVYRMFRVDVSTGEIAVLIHKVGRDISNDDEVSPGEEFKGVQPVVLTEGRYFRNPYAWTWEIHDQIVIPKDRLGVKISLTGDDLPYGEFVAKEKDGKVTSKGIVADVLRPGRYPINPYLFKVEFQSHQPVVIPAGYKGIVTNLSGPLPADATKLLVAKGERGVQEATLNPGTYYVNPYLKRISLVDCRSQRYNLAETKDMGFPSKDGFWVLLDGRIEFRINPERAAEVYVTYNDHFNLDQIDEEIVSKIIMPNARSFCRLEGSNKLGRDFIEGETRTQFQLNFEEAMQLACEPVGIEIIQALITRIQPPQKIAEPVRQRELAKQDEFKYQQQILQQDQEKVLAEKKAMVLQKQALVTTERDVVVVVVASQRDQEVAITEANQKLEVAKLRLEAAQDEADAILARGKAEASVIEFENEADAAGWKRAVAAFENDGHLYAQYVLYQKLATSYRKIMVNTADSPIMRVFESFSGSLKKAAPSAATPTASPPTASPPTADNTNR